LQGKTQHWRGKLFVFDDRLVVPIRKPAHGKQKEEEEGEDIIRWDCGGGCCVSLQSKCTVTPHGKFKLRKLIFIHF
jgi:predicted sulfurtransferase